jgi:hypothetical protein
MNKCSKSISVPLHHSGAKGEMSYSSYSFLTLELDWGEWSASLPSRGLPPGRTPGTRWIGGWVGLRAGLDTKTRGTFFVCAGDGTPERRSPSL